MRGRRQKIVIDRKYVEFLIIPLAVLAKIIRYTIMDKLVDNASAYRILEMMLYPENYSNGLAEEGTFWIAARIFRAVNVMNLSTTVQWEIFITVIFNIVCIFFVYKCKKKIELHQCIFLLCSIGLLNIFVFMISKDIIQFMFFMFIYIVLSMEKVTHRQKIVASTMILVLCGAIYRIYFLLIAAFFVIIIFLHKNLIKTSKVTNKLIIKTMFWYYCIFGIILFIFSYIVPETTNELIMIRAQTLYRLNLYGSYPVSAISEWWPSSSILLFIANHLVITIRMLIPIELVTLGVKYIPFVFYQILITINFIRGIKAIRLNSNSRNLAIFIYLAFILGSVIFEPDYGSWVRHEAAAFPIMYYVIDSSTKKNNTKNL